MEAAFAIALKYKCLLDLQGCIDHIQTIEQDSNKKQSSRMSDPDAADALCESAMLARPLCAREA